jgi:MFS family permease
MISRLKHNYEKYPRQFWLMFVGMFISTIGASMIWPFLMLYVSKRLNTPLTVTASLLTLNAATGLAASFVGGPIIDRFGRKWIMAASLASNGLMYVFLGHAATFPQFALLLGFGGAVNPLYRSAADAMVADLVPPDKRIDAYSLLRWSNNLGASPSAP